MVVISFIILFYLYTRARSNVMGYLFIFSKFEEQEKVEDGLGLSGLEE